MLNQVVFFKSKKLSLNGNISRACHIDNKGSADGLPIGGGTGEGVERFKAEHVRYPEIHFSGAEGQKVLMYFFGMEKLMLQVII